MRWSRKKNQAFQFPISYIHNCSWYQSKSTNESPLSPVGKKTTLQSLGDGYCPKESLVVAMKNSRKHPPSSTTRHNAGEKNECRLAVRSSVHLTPIWLLEIISVTWSTAAGTVVIFLVVTQITSSRWSRSFDVNPSVITTAAGTFAV